MQPRLFASLVIFLGSYLPLSLILLVQDFKYDKIGEGLCINVLNPGCDLPIQNPHFSIPILLLCLLCFLLALLALKSAKPNKQIKLVEVKHIPAELMSYTLPYVVSFMSLDYQETGKFIGVIIFLSWMFVITHRSGQIVLNPLLIVFGWRLSEVKYNYLNQPRHHSGRVLVKSEVAAGDILQVVAIQDVLVAQSD